MSPRILVADDDPATCALIARALRPHGYEVTTAADGETALLTAAVWRPNLVIADVFLPGLDGLTVIDTLRQQDPQLLVIAISALADVLERPEFVPPGLDVDAIPFLAKPFRLVPLITLVQQLLTDAVQG